MIILEIICWLSLFLVAYSYLLFPWIMSLMDRTLVKRTLAKKETGQTGAVPAQGIPRPSISILMAAYNEESVLEEKLESIYRSSYPGDKLEVLVGSDASTDRTGEILKKWESEKGLKAMLFEKRQGKPGIINRLAEMATGELLVITDADVLLETDTLEKLTTAFTDPDTGLADTRMMNRSDSRKGITLQEKLYSGREVRIKQLESRLWKSMMGPFGGCYGLRRELYQPVPANYLVDDFFINMKVLEQGKGAVSCPDARVSEKLSGDAREEFRRKKRISTGNFQNLFHFRHMLCSKRPGVSFCFISHKVFRWTAPFLLLLATVTSASLATISLTRAAGDPLYPALAGALLIMFISPIIDHFLRKIGLQLLPLRFVSHFIMMNLALLTGFIQYLRGVNSNVWQPTSRKPHKA